MKKLVLLLLSICIICGSPLNAQVGRFLNKVSKSVANDVMGKPEGNSNAKNTEPEPKCACEKPDLIVDLGGKFQLMYSEITISINDDGELLLKDRTTGQYYVVKDGAPQGPVKSGDPRLNGFNLDESGSSDSNNDDQAKKDRWLNNPYITKTGEKYTIKFNGTTYGPYGLIKEFKVTRAKDKFAAIVTENVPMSEAEGKKMDDAIKNAKTEAEKRALAMQYSQQMMQKMQQGGGPQAMLDKLVTNIPGVNWDPLKSVGGNLNSSIKYDDILFKTYDKVIDLSNKVLINISPDAQSSESFFVNTSNTRYAWYTYGTLTFGDGASMSELFNPHLVKSDGQVSLAYMYYSPKANAIMQCKLPF